MSNKEISSLNNPSTEKLPRQKVSNRSLKRQQDKADKLRKQKERLIQSGISQQHSPEISILPKTQKNPDSILSQYMVWSDTKADKIGDWSWGVKRSQLEDDIHEIGSFLDNLKALTWTEIYSQTVNNHKKHHEHEISTIHKEAQKRWCAIGLEMIDIAFRFRVNGTKRIWGYVSLGKFYLIWWDPTHQIYRVPKRHT